jgi:hypothetical protein
VNTYAKKLSRTAIIHSFLNSSGIKAADESADAITSDDRRPHLQFFKSLEKGDVAEALGSAPYSATPIRSWTVSTSI